MIDETRKIVQVDRDHIMFRYVKSHSGELVHSSIFLQENQEPPDNEFDNCIRRREPQHGLLMSNVILYNAIMDNILS